MALFRELDSRKMRDRDASSGDRGNGEDLETLTGGTPIPGGVSGTEGYGDQDTGMGSGYSSGGQMAPSGHTGGSADAGDTGNRGDYSGEDDMNASSFGGKREPGDALPDSGGPDVSDMGENEPNTPYSNPDADEERRGQTTDMGSSGRMMGKSPAGADSDTAGVGMGTGTGGDSAIDMGSSTATGGNWGDPGATTGAGREIGERTTTSGQNWADPTGSSGAGAKSTSSAPGGGSG